VEPAEAAEHILHSDPIQRADVHCYALHLALAAGGITHGGITPTRTPFPAATHARARPGTYNVRTTSNRQKPGGIRHLLALTTAQQPHELKE